MRSNIDYVFFGSPAFAVSVLEQLTDADLPPSLIVSGPDRKRGRGQKLQPTPVKKWAQTHDIPVQTPDSVGKKAFKRISDQAPQKTRWPLFVVVAYGQILPEDVIYHPEHNTLNLHPSLLPRVRGAAPIRGTILHEDKAGVTIIELDEEMDHGPIVAQEEVQTDMWPPYYYELKSNLAEVGGQLLADTIPKWTAGSIEASPQNHDEATYVGKFTSEDGHVDLSNSTETNLRKIRAFTDWPKAHFYRDDTRILITKAHRDGDELIIDSVKPAGQSEMSYTAFQEWLED